MLLVSENMKHRIELSFFREGAKEQIFWERDLQKKTVFPLSDIYRIGNNTEKLPGL